MSLKLFRGDDPISVVSWINRYGDLAGRRLRFIVPLESKATLEANQSETFTLKRGDSQSWDLRIESIEHQMTGTNGVKVVGRVGDEAARKRKKKKKPEAGEIHLPPPSEVSVVEEDEFEEPDPSEVETVDLDREEPDEEAADVDDEDPVESEDSEA